MKSKIDAQAVIYKRIGDKMEFLLLKRFDKDKNESQYRLVKGGKEEFDENLEMTILREIKEETGLNSTKVVLKIRDYSFTATEIKHEVSVYLVENMGNEDLRIDSENEGGFTIENAEWLSGNDAIDYLAFEDEKTSIKQSGEILGTKY